MLKKIIFGITVSSLMCFNAAHATFIDNGISTVDTATGLEWLDVPLTIGQSYNSIIGGFGGYAAQGYVHSTSSQLCTLFAKFGDVLPGCGTGNQDGSYTSANATVITTLLGTTSPGGTFGIHDGGLIGSGIVGLGCLNDDTGVDCYSSVFPPNWLVYTNWLGLDTVHSLVGHFLVRGAIPSVPEPGILALIGLAMVGLSFRKGRTR